MTLPEDHLVHILRQDDLLARTQAHNLDDPAPCWIVGWGGSAPDDGSLGQGAFQILVAVPFTEHLSDLAGRVWRSLWESSHYEPLSFSATTPFPGRSGSDKLGLIVGDTTYTWWLPDEVPHISPG